MSMKGKKERTRQKERHVDKVGRLAGEINNSMMLYAMMIRK